MAQPTPAEIDAFLNRLTDPKDREILTAVLALLVAAQTQATLSAGALNNIGALAGQIGTNTQAVAQNLTAQAQQGTAAVQQTLARVRTAYQKANDGLTAGMASAEDFIKVYKNEETAAGGAGAGAVFKGMAGALLNVVLPGASNVFKILSGA